MDTNGTLLYIIQIVHRKDDKFTSFVCPFLSVPRSPVIAYNWHYFLMNTPNSNRLSALIKFLSWF